METKQKEKLQYIDLDRLKAGRFQPRKYFDKIALLELAQSIISTGLIEPVIVVWKKHCYEILAGERRWRAHLLALQIEPDNVELDKIKCIVHFDLTPQEELEISLIENIQREDLTLVEEIDALYLLKSKFGLTDKEVGLRIGKDRVTICNMLRLRTLSQPVLELIESGKLDMGAARTLVKVPQFEQYKFAIRACNQSVRKTEKMIQEYFDKEAPLDKNNKEKYRVVLHRELKAIERLASDYFSTPVVIEFNRKKSSGEVRIRFFEDKSGGEGVDQLLGICEKFGLDMSTISIEDEHTF